MAKKELDILFGKKNIGDVKNILLKKMAPHLISVEFVDVGSIYTQGFLSPSEEGNSLL